MGLKYRADGPTTIHLNGSRAIYTAGPFHSLAKVENCPCEDGKRRNVFTSAEPDTFFSIPACVYVGKKTVSGFLSSDEQGFKFTAYSYGKNAALLKSATQQETT